MLSQHIHCNRQTRTKNMKRMIRCLGTFFTEEIMMKALILIFVVGFLIWLLTRRSRVHQNHPILLFLILAFLFRRWRH